MSDRYNQSPTPSNLTAQWARERIDAAVRKTTAQAESEQLGEDIDDMRQGMRRLPVLSRADVIYDPNATRFDLHATQPADAISVQRMHLPVSPRRSF